MKFQTKHERRTIEITDRITLFTDQLMYNQILNIKLFVVKVQRISLSDR